MLPLIITAAGPVLLLLLIAIKRHHDLANLAAALVLVLAFVSLFFIQDLVPNSIGQLLIIDNYSSFYLGVIFLAGIVIILLSMGLSGKNGGGH